MNFICDTISSKILEKHIFPNDVKSIFAEINFRKRKWLLCGAYHPPSQRDEHFFKTLIRLLILIVRMIKVLLVGDFTTEISEQHIDYFLYMYELLI